MTDKSRLVHATCVAWDGKAVLITGKSGSGKSTLGLELMSFGCVLVSDDQVALQEEGGRIFATAPETISGLIEARGVGLLRADVIERAEVKLIVDLDAVETARLPRKHRVDLLRVQMPLIRGAGRASLSPAVLQYLKIGLEKGV